MYLKRTFRKLANNFVYTGLTAFVFSKSQYFDDVSHVTITNYSPVSVTVKALKVVLKTCNFQVKNLTKKLQKIFHRKHINLQNVLTNKAITL